jgi:hypothetical protein
MSFDCVTNFVHTEPGSLDDMTPLTETHDGILPVSIHDSLENSWPGHSIGFSSWITEESRDQPKGNSTCSYGNTNPPGLSMTFFANNCLWTGCKAPQSGFLTSQDLDFHVQTFHLRLCPWPVCRKGKAFRRRSDLTRHIESVHSGHRRYVCDIPGCTKAYARNDKLTAHKRTHSVNTTNSCNAGSPSVLHAPAGPSCGTYNGEDSNLEIRGRVSPETYLDYYVVSPGPTDHSLESSSKSSGKSKGDGKSHSQQRRPSNGDDEFERSHHVLQLPPPEYIAQQEIDLPHLPTNLFVHEQDSILTGVDDRLSQCAFDPVAKYQFPVTIANGNTRPVERPGTGNEPRGYASWIVY